MAERPAAAGGAEAAAVTRDRFLDGRLVIAQPRRGYRAATDPVLLAAAVAARPGQRVLEPGCGVGVALLCLGRRVPGVALTGIERQPDYAALARMNAARNGIAARIVTGDLARLPAAETGGDFDHVMMNPPWFRADSAMRADDPGRDQAQREDTPLALWLDFGLRRLRPGGWLWLIHRTERLPEILQALDGRAGSVGVKPLAGRDGRAAERVLLCARKGARGPFRLHVPLVLHRGDRHRADGEDFTDQARAILREGAALDFD